MDDFFPGQIITSVWYELGGFHLSPGMQLMLAYMTLLDFFLRQVNPTGFGEISLV